MRKLALALAKVILDVFFHMCIFKADPPPHFCVRGCCPLQCGGFIIVTL